MNSYRFVIRNPKRKALPLAALLAVCVLPSWAASTEQAASIRIHTTNDMGLEVEAQNANLAQVLEQLAKSANMLLHYSVLPQRTVTATCVGSVKNVLTCLLGETVNTTFRYSKTANNATATPNPVEAWIMGSSLAATSTACTGDIANNRNTETATPDHASTDQTQSLLKQLKSKKADERSDAIVRLNAFSTSPDTEVLNALRQSLNDKSTQVRLQALNALTNLQGEDAMSPVLQQALSDRDSDFRAMAISLIENDTALLQQALQDPDASNRELAQSKLDSLNNETTMRP